MLFEPLEQRHLLAPIAANDSYVLVEDTTLTIHAGEGVLQNDVSDYPIFARLITDPALGNLAFGPGGDDGVGGDVAFAAEILRQRSDDGGFDQVRGQLKRRLSAHAWSAAQSCA